MKSSSTTCTASLWGYHASTRCFWCSVLLLFWNTHQFLLSLQRWEKNFLHHCLINELASSDPDIIDPCSPLSCNPWNTAGRSRAVKWQVSLHPHSPSNSSLPGHLSSFTRVPSGRLWIPDIVLEFLKEMLDEEYGFWKKKNRPNRKRTVMNY